MMRAKRALFTVLFALTVGGAGCVHRALRAPAVHATCYQFDRAYFGWSRDDSTGHPVADTSSVVELSVEPHSPYPLVPAGSSAKVVRVPLLRGSVATAKQWLDPSYWLALGRDSVLIVWRDGYIGPILRVQTRGDSLVGIMRWTTDENWRRPVDIPARAVRIDCPGSARIRLTIAGAKERG